MLILIIAGGPDKGRIYELNDGAPIVLGREGDQVKLNDRKVSREHARLWSEGGQWYLKDLGSRHGTYRNHTQLEPGQHAKLKDGDYLQIGNSVMVLGRMAAEQAERLSHIADPAQAAALPARWRKPALVAGGVSIAAMLGLGTYLAIQLDALRGESVPKEQFVQLQDQIKAQADRIESSIDRKSEMDQAVLDKTEKIAGSIDLATASVDKTRVALEDSTTQLETVATNATQQQQAIERLGDMLAKQQADDNSDQVLAAVTQMKTLLADQPSGDKLVARLEKAITDNAEAAGKAVQLALTEHKESQDAVAKNAADTEVLLERVITALAAVPTREQLAAEMRLAVAQTRSKDEQFMRHVLAELRSTGQQIKTDVTAVIDADAGQAQALMKQVVSELDKRPTGEKLAADLRKTLSEALAQNKPDNTQLTALMQKVLTELGDRPTSEQLAADLRRTIGEDAQRTELLIARVMSELGDRPTAEQIAKELQATDNETAAQTAALLEQVLGKLNTQQALSTQIASLREQIEALPGRNEKAVRTVLARLEQQDLNNTEMLKSIAQLRAAMPKDLPGQLDKVLAQLDEQVRTEQITDAIEKSMQRLAATQDKETKATLASFSKRLESLPSAQDLAKATESQEALAKLLDQGDTRKSIGELRASLETLSEKMADAPDTKLNKILKMLENREKVELMLAELHDAMGSQSKHTEKIKKELLAAIKSADQPQSNEDLNQLLALVRDRLATDDSVRQAIRDELRGAVLPNQMALADAHEVTTTTNPGQGTDTTPVIKDRRLTRLEVAYKQSFESGQPVTVGAGVVDPRTGEVSEGRLIDPAVAKALGFETWRDWYLTDKHATEMRMQQQAMRQRNANDAENGSTIKLPPVEKSNSNRPE